MLGDHTYTGLLQASNSEKKKELDLGDKFITLTSIKVTAPKEKIYSLHSNQSLHFHTATHHSRTQIQFLTSRGNTYNIVSQENR